MHVFFFMVFFFFFKQKTAYEIRLSLVGSEMCIRDSFSRVAKNCLAQMGLAARGRKVVRVLLDDLHHGAHDAERVLQRNGSSEFRWCGCEDLDRPSIGIAGAGVPRDE